MEIKKHPVQEAYRLLCGFINGEDKDDIASAHIVIEEALGYLGEALAE